MIKVISVPLKLFDTIVTPVAITTAVKFLIAEK